MIRQDEEEFARAIYPRCRSAAGRLVKAAAPRHDVDDLTQVGMMAVLAVYRRAGEVPVGLAGSIAWRQMVDLIRGEFGRNFQGAALRKPQSLHSLTPDMGNGEDWLGSDDGRQARENEARLDAQKLVRMADPGEKKVLARLAAGDKLREIASDMGVHLSRVHQIKANATARIRVRMRGCIAAHAAR